MLSGSAIVRVSVLLVVAGLLAALMQYLWLRGAGEAPAEVPTVAAPVRERAPEPAPETGAAPEAARPPALREPDRAQAQAPAQAPAQVPAQARAPEPAPLPSPAPDPTVPAQESADPRAVALVDLNTATLAQLNALKGGGTIGRAIIQRRPYGAVDQLLSKRVLSRATYERIKDQVTVQ